MIFEVTPEQIAKLNDGDLRTLIAYLCEREVRDAGYSAAGVTWGGHQNAADGGIDVRVSLGQDADIEGYIPRSETGVQVKAQDMPPQAIRAEMAPKGELLKSIKGLGSKNGAYIIVSSKSTVSDTYLAQRRRVMTDVLIGNPRADGLLVDFYDQRRLTSWVNQHPGLVIWAQNKVASAPAGWRPFEDWSSTPGSTDGEYLLDESIRVVGTALQKDGGVDAGEGIAKLRAILSKPNSIVRLVGLSGVGKTRLVQALFDKRIGKDALDPKLAIYTDISHSPEPVPLELARRLDTENRRAVLIIDNCGIELHRQLMTIATKGDGQLSVITVEYDISDDEPENTDVFRLEPASADIMEKVLKAHYPAVSQSDRRTIAKFSDGNARIAQALAANRLVKKPIHGARALGFVEL